MRQDVIRVVESYIDAVRRNDAGALPQGHETNLGPLNPGLEMSTDTAV